MKVNVLSRRWFAILLAVLVSLGMIPVFQSAKASDYDYVTITYDANGGSFSDTGTSIKQVQEAKGFPIYPTSSAVPFLVAPDKYYFIG